MAYNTIIQQMAWHAGHIKQAIAATNWWTEIHIIKQS